MENIDSKKLLLINLPGDSIRKPEEHCGLAFLKAFIEKNKIETEILDAYALRLDLQETLIKLNNWIEKNKNDILFIGISPFVTSHNSFVTVGEFIRRQEKYCYIFAGGHYASLNKEFLINKYKWLDAIIVGEGELTLLEFIFKGLNKNVPGLYIGQSKEEFIQRERIKNLDELPFQSRYLSLNQLDGQPMAITTSRGCYGDCSFCSISSFYKMNGEIKQTFRSANLVAKEIQMLVKNYGITSLKIVDDNFFRDNSDSFLEELSNKIENLKLSIRLSARPNDITENRARLLKKMGATIIGIGAESADEKSLEFFNKGIGIDSSDKAIELLNKNEITCLVNYIMFNPIIDLKGLEKNLRFVDKYKNDAVFHRINSHLWIRSTDPLVFKLIDSGLCDNSGFPYVECRYADKNVYQIMKLFDKWCNHNMNKYYENVDILMAKGIIGNEKYEKVYRKILYEDIKVLYELIKFANRNELEKKGKKFISMCLEQDKYVDR